MVNPPTQVPSQPCHFVYRKFRHDFLPPLHRLFQILADLLVGIQEEDPVVGGEGSGKILLVSMIGELALVYPGAKLPRYLCRPVGASAIYDDNLVRDPLNGPQHPRQVSLLVLRHDADCQLIHFSTGRYHSYWIISIPAPMVCLLGEKIQLNCCGSEAEFGAILQYSRADAFF